MAIATKKLTILVEADVYRALQRRVGRGNIGKFLSDVARPHLDPASSLPAEYAEMANDEAREIEAREWSEALMQDSYEIKKRKE
jgi:hypothetical protein